MYATWCVGGGVLTRGGNYCIVLTMFEFLHPNMTNWIWATSIICRAEDWIFYLGIYFKCFLYFICWESSIMVIFGNGTSWYFRSFKPQTQVFPHKIFTYFKFLGTYNPNSDTVQCLISLLIFVNVFYILCQWHVWSWDRGSIPQLEWITGSRSNYHD